MLKVGDRIPSEEITVIAGDEQSNVAADKYFANKKAVLFAVPGAFTPTCSASHLPGFVIKYDELKDKGIDEVACLSVNDSFVMKSWSDAQNAENITMIADGGAAFTRAAGLEIDTQGFGGVRSRRYSMLLEDGVVRILNAEEATGYEISDVDTLLKSL